MRQFVCIITFLLVFASVAGQTLTTSKNGSFELTDATIYYDANDALVVGKAAQFLSQDIRRVSGKSVSVRTGKPTGDRVIIIGTIDGSDFLRQLVRNGQLDVCPIKGEWERYLMTTIENPTPQIKQLLVIAGSDRRAAAYGAFAVSDAIGVNPWYWWADVPVVHKQQLPIAAKDIVSNRPSVKYRGIFINDEDWGIQPWAAKTFEKELGNIGPRTYARVCELLLRLKANYLCPAMHAVSTAFNQIAANKLVADSFAIVMGSTHCEPLLLNTASEWDKQKYGPWDYDQNKQGILHVLDQRVKNNAPFENVWTLALRGLHDAAMGVGVPMKKKVKMLQEALMDQRALLQKNLPQTPVDEIPQAFTPYKEVLDIYSAGLELPDDITIIWPDDNFGYMKRLSSPTEQKRCGRAGVYYHVSYLGVPHSYLWVSTTPTALMYEELKKAYDTTADRVWLVNCGDIKGCEPQVSFFLDMAYDIERYTSQNAPLYQGQWLARMFGEPYADDFIQLSLGLQQLAFSRKPEYMGWGFWNNVWGGGEKRTDTAFSLEHYREADNRISAYRRLGELARRLLAKANPEQYAAMYQLVYYPAKGAELLNRMNLQAQRYHKYVSQQRSECLQVKEEIKLLHDSLKIITDEYNNLLDGKWRYMMSLRQNYDNHSSYFELPVLDDVYEPDDKASFAVEAEGQHLQHGGTAIQQLPTYSSLRPSEQHWIDIYNQGKGTVAWRAKAHEPWIVLSASKGSFDYSERIEVSIDWNKVPRQTELLNGLITISSGKQQKQIAVNLFCPSLPADIHQMYVEHNGYVSIPATQYQRRSDELADHICVLPGMGLCGEVLQIGSPLDRLYDYRSKQVPYVEYDFYTFNAGLVDIYTYVMPTFALHSERDFRMPEHTNTDTKYSLRIDGGNIATPTTSAVEYSQAWYDAVLMNTRINHSRLYVSRPGRHTLRLQIGDPGLLFQKIVIDMGGLQRSYQGPASSYFHN